jgi:hypothetical protein
LDALQPAHAEYREAVFPLAVGELFFDQRAAAVEALEPLSASRDAREHAATRRHGQDWLLGLRAPERHDGIDAASLALAVDAGVVVALVHRAGLGLEAASVYRVEQRDFVIAGGLSQIQPAQVVDLAQTAANRLNVGLSG